MDRSLQRARRNAADALAKLHALERLNLAGLIDEQSYAAKVGRMQAELDRAEEEVRRLTAPAPAGPAAVSTLPPPAPRAQPPAARVPLPPAPPASPSRDDDALPPLPPPPARERTGPPLPPTATPWPHTSPPRTAPPPGVPPAADPLPTAAPTGSPPPRVLPPSLPQPAAPISAPSAPAAAPSRSGDGLPPLPPAFESTVPPHPPAAAPAATGGPSRLQDLLISVRLAAGVVVAVVAVVAVLAIRSHGSSRTATGAQPTPPDTSPVSAPIDPVLLALLSAPPGPTGAAIDPGQAADLIRAFWPIREQALVDHDRGNLSKLESGSAMQVDVVGCDRACQAAPQVRGITQLRVFVPRQERFPAAFLAEVLTTARGGDGPQVERLIFTRIARTTPWSLALDVTQPGVARLGDAPETDSAGFDQAPPALRQSPPPSALPTALADYYQYWTTHGTAPHPTAFSPGILTDQLGRQLWQRVQGDAHGGAHDTARYLADSRDGVWTFAASVLDSNGLPRTGWSLTCGTVRFRWTTAAVDPRVGPVLQPTDRSRFGNLLAPGAYASIGESGVQQVCVYEQPRFSALVAAGSPPQDTAVAASAAPR
jgi:hypothetical protein